MSDQLLNPSQLIIPVGTQIVARVAVTAASSKILCPSGAVGVIVKAPVDGVCSCGKVFVHIRTLFSVFPNE